MRVADFIRGTGINKITLHKLYNALVIRPDLNFSTYLKNKF